MLLELIVTNNANQRLPFAAVGLEHVANTTAVRVRTRQCCQVAPGHEAVGLWAKTRQRAGVRQAAERVDAGGTA